MDTLTDVAVDPTLVPLIVSVSGIPLATHIFPRGDGTIVRDGEGEYHANLDTTSRPDAWEMT